MPGAAAGQDAHGLAQLGPDVVQRDAVLGGVARAQGARADQFPEASPPGLFGQVVVDPVAERQEAQGVGDRVQGVAEGVGDPAQVPAQAARAGTAQDDARFPALPHDHVQPVRPPHREQVHHAAAGDPDHVLGQQVRPHVRHVRLGEQLEMRKLGAPERRGAGVPAL